ncbi:type I-E CRISPR-associated protein Cse2/CasB, partial [Psychrobacter sp.]|uniref:type I-E CRISPR-associated protein Cse2/CasB n=1 Tax=Psychrobacter sp. TaxID=56811 RepID=UPI0025F43741
MTPSIPTIAKQPTASTKTPYQATRYLNGCADIVLAWHNRLLEIKGTSKGKGDEQNDSEINESYAAFFRTAMSASDAAKLRRCQHMDDVAIQPAFIALWQQLQPKLLDKQSQYQSQHQPTISDNTFAAWLAIAWILAQVRTVDNHYYASRSDKGSSAKGSSAKEKGHPNTLAYVAGHKVDDRPLITPLRFEKLTAARDPDSFTTLLARLVAQLQQQGHALNVVWLANDIVHWFQDYQD